MRMLSMTPIFIAFQDTNSWVTPLGAVLLLAAIIGLPAWLFLMRYVKPTTAGERKEVVGLLLQILGSVAFILGAWFAWHQLINSRVELQNSSAALLATQQGQITERFTRSIEQLGRSDGEGASAAKNGASPDAGKNLAIRLGGIYALERISKDSEKDYYSPVISVLTAFVRQNASARIDETFVNVKPDIQAILTVLGRRARSYEHGETQRLELSSTDLSGAELTEANLAGANLTSSRFRETHLNRARLNGAQLLDARLDGAFLEGADLRGANLRGSKLKDAHLTGAKFDGADLSAADLRGAEGLTEQQLNSARSHDGALTDSASGQNQ